MNDKMLVAITITIASLVFLNSAMIRFFMKKITKLIDLIPEIERLKQVVIKFERIVDEFNINSYKVKEIEKNIADIKQDVSTLKDEVNDIKTFCKVNHQKD